jgi:uncharacterized membrane protein
MVAFRRHLRFLVAFVFGLTIWVVTSAAGGDMAMRALTAVNGFFAIYLIQMLRLTFVTGIDDLRRHAEVDDEGAALILLLAVAAVIVSVAAIFLVLNSNAGTLPQSLFALSAAPLGWLLMHVLVAYRYAHLYYAPNSAAGLEFPHATKPEPGVWDFMYFSFTIGMTAQVSDVQVATAQMRKVVLLHAIGSFFYNTVILALAVNAGLALSR